jgi:hypothetical protein
MSDGGRGRGGLDFTVDKYTELCRTIRNSKYSCLTLAEYLKVQPGAPGRSYLILRHDIDRSPLRALEVARVESQYNLKATYYFRVQKATYVPEIIDQIAGLGHEIGYHYETLDKCQGNYLSAQSLFSEELAFFRKRYDVKTVCAHGNPLTRYDNKTIWKNLRLSEFDLLGEAFLSLDFNRFAYFSDSGRTWLDDRSQKMPGKDQVETAFGNIKLRTR